MGFQSSFSLNEEQKCYLLDMNNRIRSSKDLSFKNDLKQLFCEKYPEFASFSLKCFTNHLNKVL